ncbi:hypothetical protein COCOBI_11-0130 [Coccomyxa sp. Obi]|nr:hypothetical protein COCOBI_11-0130 [Coccomyxa sp. Obi]
MEGRTSRDISSIPIDILASIIASASQDVGEILKWRIPSCSFKDACTQVLQSKLEAVFPDAPGFDRISPQSVRPIILESSESLKAAVRRCPSIQTVQWEPLPGIEWGNEDLSHSVCALLVSCCLHLTRLSLARCALKRGLLSVLGQSKYLQVLSLRHSCVLPFVYAEAWEGFPQLHCLDLSLCAGVSLSNLRLIAPQLLSLSVHDCRYLTGHQVETTSGDDNVLCQNLRCCVCLDICHAGIHDWEILSLTETAPKLRRLVVATHPSIEDFWTDGALDEFQRRRPDVMLKKSTSPLTPSEYERLGTEA